MCNSLTPSYPFVKYVGWYVPAVRYTASPVLVTYVPSAKEPVPVWLPLHVPDVA